MASRPRTCAGATPGALEPRSANLSTYNFKALPRVVSGKGSRVCSGRVGGLIQVGRHERAVGRSGELHIDTVVRDAPRPNAMDAFSRARTPPQRGRNASGPGWDDGIEPATVAWSQSQAEAWRRYQSAASPWHVVAAQAVVGLACALVVAVTMQRSGAVASSLWGAAAVVVPSALLARGMTRGVRHPLAAAAGFMFWEMLKIGVAIAMLAIAGKVVANLSWPALLVTMFVCIKVNWVALLGRGGRSVRTAEKA